MKMQTNKYIEEEFNQWTEERERTLKKLMYYAKPEDKLRYKAQIDFLSIVKINMSKILREVKQ
jgi:hypothetical protein